MKSIKLIISILVLFFISCSKVIQKQESKVKPNILFIAVDDLRPELNFYGANHIKSPNLDKLAATSLVFNKSYCNIPVCGASRTHQKLVK